MIGVICGDVIGSIYEGKEVKAIKKARRYIEEMKEKDKDFDESAVLRHRPYEERLKIMDDDLFPLGITYTDDTVLSVALCDAILGDKDYKKYLLKYGLEEIEREHDMGFDARFGKGFTKWLENGGESPDGIPSFGNGSAMRVAPIAWAFDSLDEVLDEARKSAEPSHGHEEGIKGAQAIASAVFLARNGSSKEDIKNFITETFEYDLDFDLEDLRRNYSFKSSCQESVPQAIYCFLESDNFEDSIRKSISIGGDTDTIAAMCGAISEAFYGPDAEITKRCMEYVPGEFIPVLSEFYKEYVPDFNFEEVLSEDQKWLLEDFEKDEETKDDSFSELG